MSTEQKTHFGFSEVPFEEKSSRVRGVFDSVADRYNLMNDLLSGGLHRFWKQFAVGQSGIREGSKVLDIAGGTGDLALAFATKVGSQGEVWLTDINNAMLTIGRDRLLDAGVQISVSQCDAEMIPFPSNYFNCVSVAFGLRNMTDKTRALKEMYRVLRPGGRLLVLEFSQIWKPLAPIYDFYSFKVLPIMGEVVAGDRDSYRYLAESIRMHPNQESLKVMMESAGFDSVDYFNLCVGVVALHRGTKY